MEAAKAGEGGSGTPATRNPFVSRGLAYSVVFSDVVLATVIPSNTARSGGGLLPITLEPGEWGGSWLGRMPQSASQFEQDKKER